MTFNQVVAEIPSLSFEQRQALIHQLLLMDDYDLSNDEIELVEERLKRHHVNPQSSLSLQEAKDLLRHRHNS